MSESIWHVWTGESDLSDGFDIANVAGTISTISTISTIGILTIDGATAGRTNDRLRLHDLTINATPNS